MVNVFNVLKFSHESKGMQPETMISFIFSQLLEVISGHTWTEMYTTKRDFIAEGWFSVQIGPMLLEMDSYI